jgi:hypothetical protein
MHWFTENFEISGLKIGLIYMSAGWRWRSVRGERAVFGGWVWGKGRGRTASSGVSDRQQKSGEMCGQGLRLTATAITSMFRSPQMERCPNRGAGERILARRASDAACADVRSLRNKNEDVGECVGSAHRRSLRLRHCAREGVGAGKDAGESGRFRRGARDSFLVFGHVADWHTSLLHR